MYNKVKNHWNDQYRLSANKVFAEFIYWLERGGVKAKEFIDENTDLVESVAGDLEQLSQVSQAIAKDQEPTENKDYFFSLAAKLLPKVRSVLRGKYDASIRYCEQLGIPTDGLTPENLLPSIRKSEEKCEPASVVPEVMKTTAADTATSENESEADATTSENESEADIATSENESEDLKNRITTLVDNGATKSGVWAEVDTYAKQIGWTRNKVWEYVDQLAKRTNE